MEKFDQMLFRAVCWICGLLMAGMLIIIFSQVVARYIFGYSLTWSEEIGRYIFVWITFLGMTVAFRAGSHVALDFLCKSLSGLPRKMLETVNGLLILLLAAAIVYSGWNLFLLGMRQKSPALKIPMQWVYIVVPVSGVILLIFALRVFWLRYRECGQE